MGILEGHRRLLKLSASALHSERAVLKADYAEWPWPERHFHETISNAAGSCEPAVVPSLVLSRIVVVRSIWVNSEMLSPSNSKLLGVIHEIRTDRYGSIYQDK
jgi:hypothetical protein